MTRKELTQEMRAISEMMGKTKNCTKTEWERTNKKQYAEYKAEHDRLRAEYDRKYAGSTTSPEKREKPRKTASAPAKTNFLWEEEKKSREDKIKELMRYGYSREVAERAVAKADEFWARERRMDSYTPRMETVVEYDPKGKPAKLKGSAKQGKSAPRSKAAPELKGPKPKKVYYNDKGGVVYRQSTDKIGDTLINQAGVKYKITGERFVRPTGDPGEVLVRVLKLEPAGHKDTQSFEVNDQMLKYYREKQIMKRQAPQKAKANPKKKKK